MLTTHHLKFSKIAVSIRERPPFPKIKTGNVLEPTPQMRELVRRTLGQLVEDQTVLFRGTVARNVALVCQKQIQLL